MNRLHWVDAVRGVPAADLARTSILFLGHIASARAQSPERRIMELFHQTYLHAYLLMTGLNKDEYTAWLPIIAAARLDDGIIEVQDWLLAQVRLML